jgi:NAD(P)-dependent dehydrogenase (short-subunit alcohol dehydrogenase family)
MAGILEGKVALITGAGSGIGRATSRIFAREGAKLVLADVVEEGGQQTLAMLNDTGHRDAIFIKADVSKTEDVDAAIAKAVATYGRLDCAFNNAGIEGKNGLTHECERDNWDRVIAINLTGVWLCMKAELAQMLKQGKAARLSIRPRARDSRACAGCRPTWPRSMALRDSLARRPSSTASMASE